MSVGILLLSFAWAVCSATFTPQDINFILKDAERITKPVKSTKTTNSAFEGDICNIHKYPVPGDEPQFFYLCLQPTNDKNNWPWSDIGVWTKMKCKTGRWFSPEHRLCRSAKSVRRMQQSFCKTWPDYCQPMNPLPMPVAQPAPIMSQCLQPPCPQPVAPAPAPQPVAQPSCPQPPCQPQPVTCQPQQPNCQQPVIPKPCPLAPQSNSGQPGGICSWMLAPLVPNSGNPKGYLQCVPKMPGQYCGQWLARPCAKATKFDGRLQVCVHDESAGPISNVCSPSAAPIGPCNVSQQCPGSASCQVQQNTCCQPLGG